MFQNNVFFFYKLQTEGSENYTWLGNQPNVECSGCSGLRKQVVELRNMLTAPPVRQGEDDVPCNSTYISECKQMEIDKVAMDYRRKAETFQEAYEKVKKITF